MAVPAYANIRWDGNIINNSDGYDYDGGFSKIVPIGKRINFSQMVGKIARAIGLSKNNEYIETISFRKPTIVDGSLKFECMDIWGEDDMCSMFNYLYQIGGLPGIEIYVKVLRCADATNEDVDIGSSGTAVESNAEQCEEQNVVDDYELSDSLAGPSSNLSHTVQDENEDDDDDDDDSWMSTEDDDDDDYGQEGNVSESEYYNTQFSNPILPVVHPPPYAEIDFDLLRVDPYDKAEGRSFWDPSKEFSVGMIFSSRDAVAAAAKEYHLRHHHQFCYHETREKTYSIKCKDKDSGCPWRLRASKTEGSDIWKITRYSGPHTCTNPQLTKNHSQLDENFICSFIFALIEQQPDIKIAALQAEVRDKFGYEPSYQKTWKAKQKAIARLYGGWDESYGRLRRFMTALHHFNPETVYMIEDNPHWINERLNPMCRVFDRMFWAFKQSIEGFKYCRPVVSIDGTFLYGKYTGCILCATAFDGNNQLFPLAFAIVDKEDGDNWSWFLDCLRIFVTNREDLCVISDRHAGILKAMQKDWWQPPAGHHRYCIRHVLSNYNKTFKNAVIKEALRKAANENQKRKFYEAMNNIREVHPELYDWAMKINLEKWTRSHDGGQRYGVMTTNMAESLNGMMKGFRALPITAMVEKIFFQCVHYFDTRRTTFLNQQMKGYIFSQFCSETLRANAIKANGHRVRRFNSQTMVCEIITANGRQKQVVKLMDQTYTCGKFQEIRIPCSHAIAACMSHSIDYEQFQMDFLSCLTFVEQERKDD
ncbi:uncharacterized protein LOC110604952 [Manihot esculenta]|uniref:uncharacterized protein LOC110604952 n=1 Tax=Manihot esculenta TaxID=3983 RepID=UPI001CC60C18|nr:uncharacterized protein LOC110604952 [Manihot esculenta]